jgi:transposase
MRKISEALRLRAEGLSIRDIAAAIGAGAGTVYEYLRRAEAAGICWPLGEDLDDEGLEEMLFPTPTAELEARRPVPDWAQVHRELKAKKHVTLRLIWLEWRAERPEGWGYSQFCWHYKRWLGTQDVVMRLSYAAGERMFVDFAGDKATWVEPDSGEAQQAEVFVAVLGASGMLYVEATRSQDLGSWVGAHIGAWEAFGGVATVTVPEYVPRYIIGLVCPRGLCGRRVRRRCCHVGGRLLTGWLRAHNAWRAREGASSHPF